MNIHKVSLFAFLILTIFQSYATAQDSLVLTLVIKSELKTNVSISYTNRQLNEYAVNKTDAQQTDSTWNVLNYPISDDFLDLEVLFDSNKPDNRVIIDRFTWEKDDLQSTIRNLEVLDIFDSGVDLVLEPDSTISGVLEKGRSKLRMNYSKNKKHLFIINNIPYVVGEVVIETSSKSDFKLHVYPGTSLLEGYSFNSENHFYDYYQTGGEELIEIKTYTKYRPDKLRIDFENIKDTVHLKSISFNSIGLNRNWQQVAIFNDFQLVTGGVSSNFNDGLVSLVSPAGYFSIVTNRLLSDQEFQAKKKSNAYILIILFVPILFYINKRYFI